MKPANFSPIFASMYCGLCSVARDHGYALTVHGTMSLDFDVVAIPWTEEAVEPQELVDALSNLMNLCAGELFEGVSTSPEVKPHGRLAWLLQFGSGAQIDLSIMPKLNKK